MEAQGRSEKEPPQPERGDPREAGGLGPPGNDRCCRAPGAEAARLFLRDPEWAAPVILMSELTNVLLGFVRRGSVTPDQAKAMCDDAAAVLGPGS